MKWGIAPRHRRFEEKVNEKIMPLYDEDIFMAFDDCVPEDGEFKLKERTEQVKSGITTANEERAKIGIDPHPDGDKLRIQGSGNQQSDNDNPDEDEKELAEFASKIAEYAMEEIRELN